MKKFYLMIIILVCLSGCSVYSPLTTCDGFNELGTTCVPVLTNMEYAELKASGMTDSEIKQHVNNRASQSAKGSNVIPNSFICDNETNFCTFSADIKLIDKFVKAEEFSRIVIEKKTGMSETDPVLRPSKIIKVTIYPYLDAEGSKFYQLRHVFVKTAFDEWVVSDNMLVTKNGKLIMDKKAKIIWSDKISSKTTRPLEALHVSSEEGFSKTKLNNEKFQVNDLVTINVHMLNIRKEPKYKSSIIGVVPEGAKLKIIDYNEDDKDAWYKVSNVYYPDLQVTKKYPEGWVKGLYLIKIDKDNL